jgi:hypothetical protein
MLEGVCDIDWNSGRKLSTFPLESICDALRFEYEQITAATCYRFVISL